MELKYKDMIKALGSIEEEHNISANIVMEALCEAMAKAYKKEAELQDIDVYAEINKKTKTIDLFQNYRVVEEVEDDELEISLEDAKKIDPSAEIDSVVSRQIEMPSFSRAAATLTRNVMRQKIREAEKVAVYEEYIDQLHEMVLGIVESVKEKFTLVNLGRTTAVMPRYQEIPQERLVEGQQIRVVITEVSKETKGSQVTVSRADAMLVKRLFEKEVPEIYNGTVEIKAIARDAGERTKMAVISHNPDVDAIGACIGPRGQRVQQIIEELKGEKIDIFQWSDDITELVRNALAPAEIQAVLPGADDRSLIVVVDQDQLSLAIGKRGKNARLAVKLTDRKIDIKTREELEEAGYDYEQMLADAEVKKEAYRREAARREIERMEAEARAAEEKRLAALQALEEKRAEQPAVEMEEDGFIPEEMQEAVSEKIITDMAMEAAEEKAEETEDTAADSAVSETVAEEAEGEEKAEAAETAEAETAMETAGEEKKTPVRHRHADLESMAEKNTYVSKFEKLTDTSAKPKQDFKSRKKKKKNDSEDNYKIDNKELRRQIEEKLAATQQKPLYTEEELEEIEAQRQAEEDRELGIDDEYDDEYDDYYDDEEN